MGGRQRTSLFMTEEKAKPQRQQRKAQQQKGRGKRRR